MTVEEPRFDDDGGGREEGREDSGQLRERIRKQFREHEELALWMRALLLLVGWLVVLLGIAGLVLPGIQGVVTLVAGAAILSLASEVAYKVLRWAFQRWPRGWRRVAKWRRKLRRKLLKFAARRPPKRRGGPGGKGGS